MFTSVVHVWKELLMPLSTGEDTNCQPADTSSSHNSSVSYHRQLECSTGMTEGAPDPTTTTPQLSLSTPLPHQHASWLNSPAGSNPPKSSPANRSLKTNGEELFGSEDAAGAVLSKATSHLLSLPLSLSHTNITLSPPFQPPLRTPWPPSPQEGSRGGGSLGSALLSACSSFEVSSARIWTVFTWRLLPCCVCQAEVITAQRVVPTAMTRRGRCGEGGGARSTSVSRAALTHSDVVQTRQLPSGVRLHGHDLLK